MPIPQEVAPVEESKITELMQEETAKKADAPQVIAADADLQPIGDFDIFGKSGGKFLMSQEEEEDKQEA